MKFCNKKLKTKDGSPRGRCTRPLGHNHRGGCCTNNLCTRCGKTPRIHKVHCQKCNTEYHREINGGQPQILQNPGKWHTFRCGCSGILPEKGSSNKFAVYHTRGVRLTSPFRCRVAGIMISSRHSATLRKHMPINPVSHSVIRAMMDDPNCERCGEPLNWEIGVWKTPHLHHNHETGKPLGFTHPVCNPQAMQDEIDRLRDQIKKLQDTRPPQGEIRQVTK